MVLQKGSAVAFVLLIFLPISSQIRSLIPVLVISKRLVQHSPPATGVRDGEHVGRQPHS
jgi:hypothetical protein